MQDAKIEGDTRESLDLRISVGITHNTEDKIARYLLHADTPKTFNIKD